MKYGLTNSKFKNVQPSLKKKSGKPSSA